MQTNLEPKWDDDYDTWRSSLSSAQQNWYTCSRNVTSHERAEHQMNDFESRSSTLFLSSFGP